jgi:hypothetical protein
MTYELWDTDVGNLVVHSQDDFETAQMIRSLVDHHGHGQANELTLSIDDADGNQQQLLTGAGLVRWANEILDNPNGRHDQDTEKIISATADRANR